MSGIRQKRLGSSPDAPSLCCWAAYEVFVKLADMTCPERFELLTT